MSSLAVRRSLYGKLAADTTLNNLLGAPPTGWSKSIFYEVAPEGARFPFVVFSKSSGLPTWTMTNSGTAAFDSEVWQFKAVDRQTPTTNSADGAETIMARVEQLLSDASLSISGRSLMFLRRESDIDYSEVVDGLTYRHSGADFRLISQPS